MDANWNTFSELKESDVNVIQVIDQEELTCFTFEGLKRRLKIHPETLSRILNRLTEDDFLEKTDSDYVLTSKAKELLKTITSESTNPDHTVLQSFLPPQLHVNEIVSELKGKWFGALRWLGYSSADGDIALKWITDDGGAIVSGVFSKGILYINVKIVSENDVNSALNASYQLMGHITKLISKTEHN